MVGYFEIHVRGLKVNPYSWSPMLCTPLDSHNQHWHLYVGYYEKNVGKSWDKFSLRGGIGASKVPATLLFSQVLEGEARCFQTNFKNLDQLSEACKYFELHSRGLEVNPLYWQSMLQISLNVLTKPVTIIDTDRFTLSTIHEM